MYFLAKWRLLFTYQYNPHIKSCEISCSLGVHPSHRRSEIWFNIFLFLFSIQTVTCFLHARKHDFWYSTNNSFRLVHITCVMFGFELLPLYKSRPPSPKSERCKTLLWCEWSVLYSSNWYTLTCYFNIKILV